ncbi:MAG: hypothetical protein DMF50_05740 [Acidobacteria bacterium]|nr:MAG: hypothetical protein DMF50_05740 [Acidobacteriota bacterium]
MTGAVVLLPLYIVLSCIGPGLLLARRSGWSGAGWSPAETLTASVALSLVGLYLASFLIFALDLAPAVHVVLLAVCAFLTFAAAPDLRRLLASTEARGLLAWLGLIALWSVSLQALVRGYSGGDWYWDWLEHFERSRFFLGPPVDGGTFRAYSLPARPPLMNLLAAHLLAVAGSRFRVYQVAACLLGIFAFLPVSLLAGRFAPGRERPAAIAAALLMLNPMFVENATYPWTKLLCVFFILSGLAFYLAGAARNDFPRLLLAFTCLAAAVATHYSAAPYALFLAGHYLLFVVPRARRPWRDVAAIAAAAGLVLGSWLAWSVLTYGARETIVATPTVRDAAAFSAAGNLSKVGRNLERTLVPHALRFEAGASWGGLRDGFFRLYQSNLPFALGILGPVLLACALRLRRRSGASVEPAGGPSFFGPRFWIGFVLFDLLVGIAVHGGEAPSGLAQVSLQPLVMLGVAFIAARFAGLPRGVRLLAAAGLLFDLVFGILLHFRLQSLPWDDPGGAGLFAPTHADLAIGSSQGNWALKQEYGVVFLGDVLQGWRWVPVLLAAVSLAAALAVLLRAAIRPPTR